MKPLSILFAGTPEFSVPALHALAEAGHRIVAVYTQPDRPAGRGQQVSMSAVKQAALKHGLRVEQPPTLRNAEAVDRLASLEADLMVVVAYGLILPQAVLDVPPRGCINIHGSLLPRWRGAAPIHRAILAGDTQTGITIMQMDAGLDTGPMLLERPTAIEAHDTSGTLHDRLAAIGAQAVVDAIEGLTSGTIKPKPQPENGVTYAAKIRKEEAFLDWRKSSVELDRQVRAFNPWPVAQTLWEGQQLRIWQANAIETEATNTPGTVLHGDSTGIQVATGAGVLNVTRVQLAGRKAVSAAEFLNAHRISGAVLT